MLGTLFSIGATENKKKYFAYYFFFKNLVDPVILFNKGALFVQLDEG